MPALCGDGIRHILSRRYCLGDPPAPEQPAAVVDDRRLARRHAIFVALEAQPLAVDDRRHRRRERADLRSDLTLILADPVPLLDPHRVYRQRAPWADNQPPSVGLDLDDV